MIKIDTFSLSPIGTNEFPCMGTKTFVHYHGRTPIPDNIGLQIGIKLLDSNTVTQIFVKLPYTEAVIHNRNLLVSKFKSGSYPIGVTFDNLCCFKSYDFYIATATNFSIVEE